MSECFSYIFQVKIEDLKNVYEFTASFYEDCGLDEDLEKLKSKLETFNFSFLLDYIVSGKLINYARLRSLDKFDKDIKSDKIVIPGINPIVTNLFFIQLFTILLDKKFPQTVKPLIDYAPLTKGDHEILVYIGASGVTALYKRLASGPAKVLLSMTCKPSDEDVSPHIGMVIDHDRGGLKYLKKPCTEFMAALENIFREQSTTASIVRDDFIKACRMKCSKLFMACIDPVFHEKEHEDDVSLAFVRLIVYFFRCRAHHTAKILSSDDCGKKEKSTV